MLPLAEPARASLDYLQTAFGTPSEGLLDHLKPDGVYGSQPSPKIFLGGKGVGLNEGSQQRQRESHLRTGVIHLKQQHLPIDFILEMVHLSGLSQCAEPHGHGIARDSLRETSS